MLVTSIGLVVGCQAARPATQIVAPPAAVVQNPADAAEALRARIAALGEPLRLAFSLSQRGRRGEEVKVWPEITGTIDLFNGGATSELFRKDPVSKKEEVFLRYRRNRSTVVEWTPEGGDLQFEYPGGDSVGDIQSVYPTDIDPCRFGSLVTTAMDSGDDEGFITDVIGIVRESEGGRLNADGTVHYNLVERFGESEYRYTVVLDWARRFPIVSKSATQEKFDPKTGALKQSITRDCLYRERR